MDAVYKCTKCVYKHGGEITEKDWVFISEMICPICNNKSIVVKDTLRGKKEKYIIILEDGHILISSEISELDIWTAKEGYIDIIRSSDFKHIDSEGEWVETESV